MTQKIAPMFAGSILPALREMRGAGMSETQIACIVSDIRAAAIHEERIRAEFVLKNHPPSFPTFTEMRDELKWTLPDEA